MSVPGPGVYRSDDGGETWRYLLRHTSRPMYHGRIAINPLDDNLIYVIARTYRFSKDGGRTFTGKPWRGAGGDDHDLWISPQDKNVFYTASDQGAHLTADGGSSFISFMECNVSMVASRSSNSRLAAILNAITRATSLSLIFMLFVAIRL